MKILLVPNVTKERALQVSKQAAQILNQNHATVLSENIYCSYFNEIPYIKSLPEDIAYSEADVVVSIGGDGTMLHTAKKTKEYDKPLVGINTGRLGFLTALEDDELEKLVLLTEKKYKIERRNMISYDNSANQSSDMALNDIVLFKKSVEKTISLEIYCDGILMSTFRGDGVVFSTPTGSTAYSMSAGGPIVDAKLASIIVTQICAHIVHMPPMVVAPDRTIQVISKGEKEETGSIIVDGIEQDVFYPGDELTITLSDSKVPLIQFYDTDQLKSIDTKLKGR